VAVEDGAHRQIVLGVLGYGQAHAASPCASCPPLIDQISTIIVGKRPQIEDCVACLLAGGHLLIEDVPGVGKTTLAHALAVSLGLRSRACSSPPT
jgi:MoxR-like ATPase